MFTAANADHVAFPHSHFLGPQPQLPQPVLSCRQLGLWLQLWDALQASLRSPMAASLGARQWSLTTAWRF